MAQTKRKRRSKHRGTPAGTVEARGRTGRKPRPEEKDLKQVARERRAARLDRPPSWRSAANRAVFATLVFFALIVLLMKTPIEQALSLAGFMLLVYIPLGYYTDLLIWRRRQRRKARPTPEKP